jgi:hypothetical protein
VTCANKQQFRGPPLAMDGDRSMPISAFRRLSIKTAPRSVSQLLNVAYSIDSLLSAPNRGIDHSNLMAVAGEIQGEVRCAACGQMALQAQMISWFWRNVPLVATSIVTAASASAAHSTADDDAHAADTIRPARSVVIGRSGATDRPWPAVVVV